MHLSRTCKRISSPVSKQDGSEFMESMQISKAFTLVEPGPVVFVTTHDGKKNNIMAIWWTMVIDNSRPAPQIPESAERIISEAV